jgi:hypothetical protein
MIITLHIISKNYTVLKKNKIYYEQKKDAKNLLDYLYQNNIIDNINYKIYYNNQEINDLPIIDVYDITLVEQTYKTCSCCKNK